MVGSLFHVATSFNSLDYVHVTIFTKVIKIRVNNFSVSNLKKELTPGHYLYKPKEVSHRHLFIFRDFAILMAELTSTQSCAKKLLASDTAAAMSLHPGEKNPFG